MSAPYRGVWSQAQIKTEVAKTPEQAYWASFQQPRSAQQLGAINSAEFSPVNGGPLIVASSTRVNLLNPISLKVDRGLGKFADVVTLARVRGDGQLVAAACGDGNVRVLSTSTRAIVRELRPTSEVSPATALAWLGLTSLAVYYDNGNGTLFELGTGEAVTTLPSHSLRVSCCVATNALIASGSADRTLKVVEGSTGKELHTFDHGAPLEASLLSVSETLLIAAGGTFIKVWDLLTGHCLARLRNHHKTITALAFSSGERYLLSASLDCHIKVYSLATYAVVHAIKLGGSIFHLTLSHDDRFLCVSLPDKVICCYERKKNATLKRPADDTIGSQVPAVSKPKINDFDRQMRQFNLTKALEVAVLSVGRPDYFVACLRQLLQADGLAAAVTGSPPALLSSLSRFVGRHIHLPLYQAVLIEVAHVLVDVGVLAESRDPDVIKSIHFLLSQIDTETTFQEEASSLMGAIEMVTASRRKLQYTDVE